MIRIRILEVFVKKQQKIKKIALPVLAAVFALAALVVGFTIAHSRDRSVLANVFEINNYQVQFTDTFQSPSNWITGQTVSKEIKVKNDTNTPVIARVKLTETWDSKDGMGLPLVGAQSNVRMAVVNYLENSGWQLDGTWWYSPVLQPGETSTSLITGVTLNEDADLGADWRYGGATYKLSAKAEVIQSELAATEWHKRAVVNITTINLKARSFNNNQCKYYDAFERASQKPVFPDGDDAHIVQPESESNTPFYLWRDGEKIVWYSDADDIYLVGSSQSMSCNYYNSLVGFRDFNTSRITTLEGWFWTLNRTSSLDGLEMWDVSNVTTMRDTFYNGSSSTGPSDISALARWDVSSVTSMRDMFVGDPIHDVSALAAWNVRNVREFHQMFATTDVYDSVCELADWPVQGDQLESWFGMFATRRGPTQVDASCLNKWNIPSDKNYSWFDRQAFIAPSWARQ